MYYIKTSVDSVEVSELIKYGPIVKIVEMTKFVFSFKKKERERSFNTYSSSGAIQGVFTCLNPFKSDSIPGR